jgi:HK97 family phage major capsid protein
VKVKLIKDWTNPADQKKSAKGVVLELPDAEATTLCSCEVAEQVAEASDAQKVVDEAFKGLEARIETAVAGSIKKAAEGFELKGGRIAVAGGKDMREDDPMSGFESSLHFYKAVKRACIGGGIDERLLIATAAGKAAGSLASGESGAFLAPIAMSERIFARTARGLSVIGLCDLLVLDGLGGVRIAAVKDDDASAAATRHAGIIVYHVAEEGAITPSSIKWREVTIMPKEIAALAAATDAMLSTISNYGERLNATMGDAFADEIAEIVMFGGGGCVGAFNSPCCLTIAKEADQIADSIVPKNIINMEAFCDETVEAQWFYNPECHTQLSLLTVTVGTSGVPVMLPAGGLSASPYTAIRGRRATKTDHCEALGDAGDIVLGDFSQYWLATSGSVKSDMSIHLYFDQAKTAFRGLIYVGGQPYWEKSRKPRKGAATTRMSPFVKLAAR